VARDAQDADHAPDRKEPSVQSTSPVARSVALLSAIAVIAVAAAGFAGPARAADPKPITLVPASGTVDQTPMFTAVTTAEACPAGYGTNVAVKIGRIGGPYNNLNTVYSDGGYDTAPLSLAANRSFTRANGNVPPAAGRYEVVIICTSETQGDLTDLFRSQQIEVTGAGWQVAGGGGPGPTPTTAGPTTAPPTGSAGGAQQVQTSIAPQAAGGGGNGGGGLPVTGAALARLIVLGLALLGVGVGVVWFTRRRKAY
jgi:hypothetical protein